jgi:molybdate transport system substrate-binding protein
LRLVALGEAPLGIVYATDAVAEPRVEMVDAFPEATHKPIIYPAAILAASSHADAARFLAFLQGRQAGAIFREEGFTLRSAGLGN